MYGHYKPVQRGRMPRQRPTSAKYTCEKRSIHTDSQENTPAHHSVAILPTMSMSYFLKKRSAWVIISSYCLALLSAAADDDVADDCSNEYNAPEGITNNRHRLGCCLRLSPPFSLKPGGRDFCSTSTSFAGMSTVFLTTHGSNSGAATAGARGRE